MIVQGTDFDTENSGVGAVVVDKQQYDKPMDAFYKADNYYNEWKIRKSREKALKQAELEKELKDYDFTTKGSNPRHADFFMNKKKEIEQSYVDLLKVKKDTPEYALKNYENKARVKQLQVLADASVGDFLSEQNQLKAFYQNPDKYDMDKTKRNLAERSTLPVEEQLKASNQPFLVPNGRDLHTIIIDMLDPKKNPAAELKQDVKKEGGYMVTTEERPYTKVQEIANNIIFTANKDSDKVMEEYEKLPDRVKDSFEKLSKDPKLNPNGYGGASLFFSELARPYVVNNIKSKVETDESKSARDYNYWHKKLSSAVKKENGTYDADVQEYINMATGNFRTEADQNEYMSTLMAEPIGETEKDGKVVPVYATNIKYIKADDGTINIQYTPTEKYNGSDGKTPIITNQPADLLDYRYIKRYGQKFNLFNNNLNNTLKAMGGSKNNITPASEFIKKSGQGMKFVESKTSNEDKLALEWVKNNPNDIRAKAIKEKLKLKGIE